MCRLLVLQESPGAGAFCAGAPPVAARMGVSALRALFVHVRRALTFAADRTRPRLSTTWRPPNVRKLLMFASDRTHDMIARDPAVFTNNWAKVQRFAGWMPADFADEAVSPSSDMVLRNVMCRAHNWFVTVEATARTAQAMRRALPSPLHAEALFDTGNALITAVLATRIR